MLLVVEAGVAVVVAEREQAPRRMIVGISGPGAVLAPPGPAEELAALTDALLTVLPDGPGRSLLALPDVAEQLVARLVDALSDRQESLAQFAYVDHRERVREKLVQLARAHGRVGSDGILLDLPLTHELLAQTTGSARETVTNAVAALRDEGFLTREGRRYRLTIPVGEVAGEDGGPPA